MHAGTGQGKTVAFLGPLIEKLQINRDSRATIILPNASLISQMTGVVERFSPEYLNQIEICTPRRLPTTMDFAVVDEADLTLSPACLAPRQSIKSFLKQLQPLNQIIYSGATFPLFERKTSIKSQILDFNPKTVVIEGENVHKTTTCGESFIDCADGREGKLLEIIENSLLELGSTMVFVNNASECDFVASVLSKNRIAFSLFPDVQCRVVIGSDVMGRGIDLPSLRTLIHYGIPLSITDYLHRLGRLGRLSSQFSAGQCRSFFLYNRSLLRTGPSYVKLLLAGEKRISSMFSRNRSLNKKLRKLEPSE